MTSLGSAIVSAIFDQALLVIAKQAKTTATTDTSTEHDDPHGDHYYTSGLFADLKRLVTSLETNPWVKCFWLDEAKDDEAKDDEAKDDEVKSSTLFGYSLSHSLAYPLGKAALATLIKTIISKAENEADGLEHAVAFLQKLCDELELDLVVRHLAPFIYPILAALHDKEEEEIKCLFFDEELKKIVALHTSISVIRISLKTDGSVNLGLSLTIAKAETPYVSDEESLGVMPGESTLHASRQEVVDLGQGWPVRL